MGDGQEVRYPSQPHSEVAHPTRHTLRCFTTPVEDRCSAAAFMPGRHTSSCESVLDVRGELRMMGASAGPHRPLIPGHCGRLAVLMPGASVAWVALGRLVGTPGLEVALEV